MDDELNLVKEAAGGSEEAWKEFVKRYTSNLRRVIERYVKNSELAGELFVSLLEKLKGGKLDTFSGKSTLSTWLFIVTRNHCRDHFRTASGIRHINSAMSGLDGLERRFFTLYFIESNPVQVTIESLRAEFGREITYLDIIECEERVRGKIEEKGLGNLMEKLLYTPKRDALPSVERISAQSGMERYFESTKPPPDTLMQSRDLARLIRYMREAVARLPHQDQLIIRMRFEHGKSARRISEILGMKDEKQVYRKLEKLFESIRADLDVRGFPPEAGRRLYQQLDLLFSWEESWENMEDPN